MTSGRKAQDPDKPNWSEIKACGHWLTHELEAIEPELVVCLGATAAQALFGRKALVTIHPSAVLRAGEERDLRRSELLGDLSRAAELLARRGQIVKTTKSWPVTWPATL